MTYEQAVEYVNSFSKFGVRPGLRRVNLLLDMLGNPQNDLKFIHVAGTNGKGSTCAFLSSILKASGFKVGLFTSPFVVDFRERFQVDEEMISQEDFEDIVEYIMPFVRNLTKYGIFVTEFEIITVIAFFWFKKKSCDIVVLEVGLGGRLDATNVIKKALVSVITMVSLDHTNILGNTVEKIAREKAGILKPNGTLVLYPHQEVAALSEIKNIADSLNNKIVVPDVSKIANVTLGLSTTSFSYLGEMYDIKLLGEHQICNAVTAISVVNELRTFGYEIPSDAMKAGLEHAKISSRFEIVSQKPLVILDGTHNPGGAKALAGAIKTYLGNKKIVAVVGMLQDKDVVNVIGVMSPLIEEFVAVQPDNPRSMSKFELCDLIQTFHKPCKVAVNLTKAVELAFDMLDDSSVLVVFGSLYLASQIRPILKSFCDEA